MCIRDSRWTGRGSRIRSCICAGYGPGTPGQDTYPEDVYKRQGLGRHEQFDGRAVGHQHQLEFLAGQAVHIVAGIDKGKGQHCGIIGVHMEAEIIRHGETPEKRTE